MPRLSRAEEVYAVTEAVVRSVRARYWREVDWGLLEEEEETRGVRAGSERWRERLGWSKGSEAMISLIRRDWRIDIW